MSNMLKTVCIAVLFAAAATSAQAGVDFSNATTYNTSYGMTPGGENATLNLPLRGGNPNAGNDQSANSTMSQQFGAQTMSDVSGSGTLTGVGYGTASAIGDSLNVVTNGDNNSTQTNNGNQTALVPLNGH